MIYVISVFFEHIAGQFSVHSSAARNILLGLLTLLLCFGPVILGASGEKKRKRALTLYIYGPVHKGAIFSCLEDDFLIDHADRIRRSIELLNTIADFL